VTFGVLRAPCAGLRSWDVKKTLGRHPCGALWESVCSALYTRLGLLQMTAWPDSETVVEMGAIALPLSPAPRALAFATDATCLQGSVVVQLLQGLKDLLVPNFSYEEHTE